jgi:hypothetical protein
LGIESNLVRLFPSEQQQSKTNNLPVDFETASDCRRCVVKVRTHIKLVISFLSLCLVTAAPVISQAGFLQVFERVVLTVMNTDASLFNSLLNIVTKCSDGSVDGIGAKCFSDGEIRSISGSIDILKARRYPVKVPGQIIQPYQFFKDHTNRLVNINSKQMQLTYLSGYGCNSSFWACHTYDGTTFISGTGITLDSVRLSGVLLHEAAHYNKPHNCGEAADKDVDGPYGYEALYHMSIYRDRFASPSQKAVAYARASGIANYQLCGNQEARDIVMNYQNEMLPVEQATIKFIQDLLL